MLNSVVHAVQSRGVRWKRVRPGVAADCEAEILGTLAEHELPLFHLVQELSCPFDRLVGTSRTLLRELNNAILASGFIAENVNLPLQAIQGVMLLGSSRTRVNDEQFRICSRLHDQIS